jgi:hypothetical protein
MSRSDAQLLGQAIKQRWKIDDKARAAAAARVVSKMLTTTNERTLRSMVDLLLRMEAQNQDDEAEQPEQPVGPTQNVVIYLPDNGRA